MPRRAGVVTSYGATYRAGETAVEVYPGDWPADNTRRGLICCHGGQATVASGAYFASGQANVANFVVRHAGLAALFGNWGSPSDSWGNDDSASALSAGWTYLKNTMKAKTDKVILLANSMGCLVALNWAKANASQVLCIVLAIPALDLKHIDDWNPLGWTQASIGTAYGVTYPTYPALAAHSPVQYSSADLTALASVPIAIWSADDDPVASPTSQCQAWAAAVGSNVTVTSMGNVGHNDQTSDAQILADRLAFVVRAGALA